ncbi:NUDIX domain-containing protein [Pseudomonas sp. NPDC088429]|uniref:NUDIX domain-containing protein n=1 Tax=unclassified Pseudomonas TaxID=196821 RepID=UPI00273E6F06|nr:NUDIX domain-containing protein [Pseudomonas sp. 18058]
MEPLNFVATAITTLKGGVEIMSGSKELHGTVICQFAEKILFVRKENPEWSLPGGKVEANELPVEGARRELKEETGLELKDAEFLGHHVFDREEHHLYRLTVRDADQPRPGAEIVECRWFTHAELKSVSVKPHNVELLKLHGLFS